MKALLSPLTGRLGVPLAMLAAALLLRCLSFVPAVIDTDEGLYIVQARAWLGGDWPLIGVWDMHPIGAPALVTLALMLPLPTIAAVRLAGAVAVAVTGTALAAVARRLGLPPVAGFGAGLLSIALTTQFGGLATNTEILFAPFVTAALALSAREAVRALDEDEPPRTAPLLAAGLLVGCALTIKPVAVAEGCFAFAAIVGPGLLRGLVPARRLAALAGLYALAAATPTMLIALAYAVQGAFWIFVDVWFRAPFRYAGEAVSLRDGGWMVVAALLVLAWPVALAVAGALRGAAGRALAFGAAWFAAASIAVALPGMFFNHYFLIWLPPVSLLAATGAWALAERLLPERAAMLFAALIGLAAADAWLGDAARRIETGPGFRRPDPVRQVAAALRETVPPGERVFIANYHPVVLVLADVAPASRYVFPAQLTGAFGPVLDTDADAEVARTLASRPAAIIVDRGWWTAMRRPVRAMLETTLAEAYTLAATVAEERGPVEIHRLREVP